jgi:hypothetical protein
MNKPRTHFIRITAALAGITCISAVAAALSFDPSSHVAAGAAATVSAAPASEPVAGAARVLREGAPLPVPLAPSATDAPTTVPTPPPASSSTSAAVVATSLPTTSTSAADGEIYGFVTVNGIPAAAASMMLEGPSGERRTQTDLRGYYSFEHVAPGEYGVIQYSVFIPAPCAPLADACLGPATRFERHAVTLSPGESRREDWATSLAST